MPNEPTFRDPREWTPRYEELQSESDRGCAIIGGAMIDQSLSKLIASFLIDDKPAVNKLLDPFGNLSSVPSRAYLAYCLGIITKGQREDIITIAKIRNYFAHHLHDASFEHEEVKKLCDKIKHYYEAYYADDRDKSPRKYFQVTIAGLIQILAIESMTHSPLKTEPL